MHVNNRKKDSRLFKYDLTDTDCTQVSGQRTLSCKFTPKSGVKSVNVVMLSGGGGGAGSTLESKQTNQTNQTTSGTTTINITQYIKNIRVTLAGAGGGGGGGAWKKENSCPENSVYLSAEQNGGKAVCVTKYNIGDIPGVIRGGIASSVTIAAVPASCTANECCWTGQTARVEGLGVRC